MKRHTNLTEEERKPTSLANHVFEEALGKAIKLDTIPTTTNLAMPEGEIGYVDAATITTLYWRQNDKIYKWTITESV